MKRQYGGNVQLKDEMSNQDVRTGREGEPDINTREEFQREKVGRMIDDSTMKEERVLEPDVEKRRKNGKAEE